MKKISITINVLFLMIILFMSCNKSEISPAAGTEVTGSKNGASTSARGSTTGREICQECGDYTGVNFPGMNATTALALSTNYKNLAQPLLQINGTTPDANSIWFSLEALKNFIWKIEEAACQKNCPDNINLGIRIYYGRYPAMMNMYSDLAVLDPAFAEHHTLFMVPTFQESAASNIHWDFDPWHWGGSGCKPTTMEQWFSNNTKPFGDEGSLIFSPNGTNYFTNPGGGLTTVMNHGDLIPPYPVTGTGF